MSKPYEGLKVIELATYVAAPSCARVMAEYGADVIKIEGLDGDPWKITCRAVSNFKPDNELMMYDTLNAGKRDICLDIRNEEGIKVLHKMLETADVLVTNIREKSLIKRSLDYETLKVKYPRLIYATITGYGKKGPEKDAAGFDGSAFWSRSGFLVDQCPTENKYPVVSPSGVGDITAGTTLTSQIGAALYRREKTGKGDYCEVSLYQMAIWVMSCMMTRAADGENMYKSRYTEASFQIIYKCADGEYFKPSVLEYNRQSPAMYKVLGVTQEELDALGVHDFESYRTNREALTKLLEEKFMAKSADEWSRLFAENDLVGAKLRHYKDVFTDEQAIVNNFVKDYTFSNNRKVLMPCPPTKLGSMEDEPLRRAPLIGEHTDEILNSLGYSTEEIDKLHKCGAVK